MPAEPVLPQPSAQPEILYQIAGDGREKLNVIGLRDRIRRGELHPTDQIAIAGTEDWKAASEYPALTRYFNLVKPSAPVAGAPAGPMESMGSRILVGLGYPFSGPIAIGLIVAALAAGFFMPLLSFVISLVASIYALTVIRTSSEGRTSAPSFSDTGGPLDWIVGFLRIIAVTLISIWPLFLAAFIQVSGLAGLLKFVVAGIVVILYYPACLASIAIWKSLKMALSVQQIFRFIGTLGADYYAVIGMWFVSFMIIGMETSVLGRMLSMPALVSAINAIGTVYLSLYASHLLGWAVYRHRDTIT